MSAGTGEYESSRIEVLEGVEAVRRRPGTYVGSTGERGPHDLVLEAARRSVSEVRRDGVHWVQEYARGVPLAPAAPVGPATGTGTTLTFRPDPGILPTARCSRDALADRFREVAFLNRPLALSLSDERPRGAHDGHDGPHSHDGAEPGSARHERFDCPGGLRD